MLFLLKTIYNNITRIYSLNKWGFCFNTVQLWINIIKWNQVKQSNIILINLLGKLIETRS